MPNLVGIGNSQVPTNAMLGGLAYQDSVEPQTIAKIKAATSDTALRVFVYDTSKDTDGGAWRKRAINQSWYTEQLGTEDRGVRKEFPAVSVIVGTANHVIIYDADDPDLPMWMKFDNNASGAMIQGGGGVTNIGIHAMNAYLAIGYNTANGSFSLINFIKDNALLGYSAVYGGTFEGTISERNTLVNKDNKTFSGWTHFYTGVNDIDMMVHDSSYQDGSVEIETGLPRPFIAVATEACTHLIRPDNEVADYSDSLSYSRGANNVIIPRNGPLRHYGHNGNGTVQNFPNWVGYHGTSDNTSDFRYDYTTVGGHPSNENVTALLGYGSVTGIERTSNPKEVIISTKSTNNNNKPTGLSLVIDGYDVNFSSNNDTIRDSMVAYITSTFNTGYIFGDAKGCFLANTTAGTIAASTNTNTNHATNCTLDGQNRLSAMTYTNGATSWTMTDDQSTVSGFAKINLIGLTAGKNYEISMTVSSHGAFNDGSPYISRVDGNASTANSTYFHEWDFTYSSSKVLTGVFKALTANDDDFVFYAADANFNVTNFSVREAQEEDRSIMDCGMGVQGVITKSPCVPGSELMAYSGWSNSNYIYQGFNQSSNSHINFGSDPFYVSCWIKHTSAVGVYQGIVWCNAMHDINNGYGWQLMMNQSDQVYFYWYGDSSNGSVGGSVASKIVDDRWHHIMVTSYSGGSKHKLYLDGVEVGSSTTNFGSVTYNPAKLVIGRWAGNKTANYHFRGSIALVKLGTLGAGTELIREEKIKQIYQAEKQLFTPNAKCTLYGSSDDVTAIAYDDVQEVLHAGTSSGRSEFSGLKRINNTTTAVTHSISASNGLVAEQ
mgnify:CR=1 FL=1